MARYRIKHNRQECIGCAACASVSDNWVLGDDGLASPKKTEISEEELAENQEAAEICPVEIIKIEKID